MTGIKKVYPNTKVQATLTETIPLIDANQIWQMPSPNGIDNLTGKGIRVGIIDTGVDYTHSDFGNCTTTQFTSGQCTKIAGGYDFVNQDNDPIDDMGHGTHVAGTIAANGTTETGQPFKGIAPDTTIYALKVLDSTGSGWSDDIIAAIDWSIDPNNDSNPIDHLDIINLSLGGIGNPDDPLSQAIDSAADAGVTPVIAAGNSGQHGFMTIGSPGTARKAITVGATFKQDYSQNLWGDSNPETDEVTPFSSKGPVLWGNDMILKPDVATPGALICATRFDSIFPQGEHPPYEPCIDNKHVLLAGTSMATPVTAGSIALIKQAHPNWTVEMIKSALITTAKEAKFNTVDNAQYPFQKEINTGGGRIQPLEAINNRLFISPTPLDLGNISIDSTQPINGTFKIKNISTTEQKIKLTGDPNYTTNFDNQIIEEFCLQPNIEKNVNIEITGNSKNLEMGIFTGTIKIETSNNCTNNGPIETKNYNMPFSYAKAKIVNIELTLKKDYSDQNFALVDLFKYPVNENGEITSSGYVLQSFLVENLSDGTKVNATLYSFDETNKQDIIATIVQFNGTLTLGGYPYINHSITYRDMIVGTTNQSGTVSLDASKAVEIKDNMEEIASENGMDAAAYDFFGPGMGWIIGDFTSCQDRLKGLKDYYFAENPNYKKYSIEKKVIGKEKSRSGKFSRKSIAMSIDFELPFDGQLKEIDENSIKQSQINIAKEVPYLSDGFGIDVYKENWSSIFTPVPYISTPRTITIFMQEAEDKGIFSTYWNWNIDWKKGETENFYFETHWNGTNYSKRVGKFPNLEVMKVPFRLGLQTYVANPTLILTKIFAQPNHFDTIVFEPLKGFIKITKPDGTSVQETGAYSGAGIICSEDCSGKTCGGDSFPKGLQDCQIGTYIFDINADTVFNSQPLLSKTLTAQWDGSKWILPKESQDIHCGPNSIIGQINGYNGYASYITSSENVAILQNILLGNSPMPSNICCIDADGNKKFEQHDIDLVQNFVNGSGETGNVNKVCVDVQ